MINRISNTNKKYRILISQPKPSHSGSPYLELAKTFNLDIDFRRLVKVEPVSKEEFTKVESLLPTHTAIIFTSKAVIDHFFNLCKQISIEINPNMKYFCITEQAANYLQKYIPIKKRKIFAGSRTVQDLLPYFKKHSKENYLFPCSEVKNKEISIFFEKNNYNFSDVIVYRTIADDLKDLNASSYDVVTFFSPSDVASYFENFQSNDHSETIFATFGENTSKSLSEFFGIKASIEAPSHKAPSMAKAIELFLSNN